MIYINDRHFTKEIIISKGKGKLTKTAGELIYKLSKRVFQGHKRMSYLKDNIYYEDILSGGLYAGLTSWKTFNHNKYDSAFAYMTEVIKRGQTSVYNKVILNKDWQGNTNILVSWDFYGIYDKKEN